MSITTAPSTTTITAVSSRSTNGLAVRPGRARLRSAEGYEGLADGVQGLVDDAEDAAGGSAILWRGELLSAADEQRLVAQLQQARAEEYSALMVQAEQATDATGSAATRAAADPAPGLLPATGAGTCPPHRRHTSPSRPASRPRPAREVIAGEVGDPGRGAHRPGRVGLADPPVHRRRRHVRLRDRPGRRSRPTPSRSTCAASSSATTATTAPSRPCSADTTCSTRCCGGSPRSSTRPTSRTTATTPPKPPVSTSSLRGLSMTLDDDQVIDHGTAIFDGLYAYFHRALLAGKDPA